MELYVKGFELLKKGNFKKIIIDVSGNGGGRICLGTALSRLLFPSNVDHNSDFISSPLHVALATDGSKNEESFYFTGNWMDPKNNLQKFTSSDFMVKGPSYTRGGKTSQYTDQCVLDCNNIYNAIPGTGKNMFRPEDVAILSDGNCGSTCALLTNALVENFNVTTFGYGGLSTIPMSFSSFAGGQVFSMDDLIDRSESIASVKEFLPKKFVRQSSLSFTLREVYSKSMPELPLEWTYLPTRVRIPNRSDLNFNPVALWNEVAHKMKQIE
jgi:hypothetical protein